jgi:tetratricopeptide (TPR) repeat protein
MRNPITRLILVGSLSASLVLIGCGGLLAQDASKVEQELRNKITDLTDEQEAYKKELEQLRGLLEELRVKAQAQKAISDRAARKEPPVLPTPPKVEVSEIVVDGQVLSIVTKDGKVQEIEKRSSSSTPRVDVQTIEEGGKTYTVVTKGRATSGSSEEVRQGDWDHAPSAPPSPVSVTVHGKDPSPHEPPAGRYGGTTAVSSASSSAPEGVWRKTTYYLGGRGEQLEDVLLASGNPGLVSILRFEKAKLYRSLKMHDQAIAELIKITETDIDEMVTEAARWTLVEIFEERDEKQRAIGELEKILETTRDMKKKMDAVYGIISLAGNDPLIRIREIEKLIEKLEATPKPGPDVSSQQDTLPRAFEVKKSQSTPFQADVSPAEPTLPSTSGAVPAAVDTMPTVTPSSPATPAVTAPQPIAETPGL